MRLANLAGRAVLLVDGKAVDLARASGGQFGPDPQSIYEEFDELRRWASQADLSAGVDFDPADLDSPAPRPGQLFGIGLNYRQHAE